MIPDHKTIYVDMDDVICETARHCIHLVEREFGKRVGFEELTHFDLGASCRLEPDEREHLYRVIHEPEELLSLTPIPDAVATLSQWVELGYEIAIVTGRPPSTIEASQSWLERYEVPHVSLTMVDKYGRFETFGTSAIALQELAARSYAFAVEDSLPVAHFLAAEMDLRVLLIDRPWNRSDTTHTNVTRHHTWRGIAAQNFDEL